MFSDWKTLLVHLNLNEAAITEPDILALENWCQVYVSKEKIFSETSSDRYAAIKNYLSLFFETIANCPLDQLNEVQPDLNDMNAIQFAALQGYDQWIAYQLEKTENIERLINSQTKTGVSALHLAALGGQLQTVNLLLSYKANPQLTTSLGKTPLQLTLTYQSNDQTRDQTKKTAIFNRLLEEDKTLLTSCDMTGNTIAHCMAESNFSTLLESLNEICPTLLLTKNRLGHSPLHTAILNNHLDSVSVLAKVPDLLTVTDNDGRLPVMYTIKKKDQRFFQALETANMGTEVNHLSFKC